MSDKFTENDILQLFALAFSDGHPDVMRVAIQATRSSGFQLNNLVFQAYPIGGIVNSNTLKIIADYGCLDALLGLLKHDDYEVRADVVKALCDVGGPVALNAIKEAQKDDDDYVRMWARRALGDLKDKTEANSSNRGTSLKIPAKTLNQLDSHGKAIVKLILQRIEPSDFSIIVSLADHPCKSIRIAAQKAILEGGKPAHDILFDSFENNKLPITIEYVQFIRKIQDSRAVDIFLATARRAQGEVQIECVNALTEFGGIRNTEVIHTLIELLTQWNLHENLKLRSAIRNAITSIGQAAAPALLKAFVQSSGIRCHEGNLVAQVAGERAISILVDALKDHYRVVRENAANGLALLGKSAVRELVKLMYEGDLITKRLAISVLGKIGDIESFDIIVNMVDDLEVRDVVIESLGGFPVDHSFELLSMILREEKSIDQRFAWKAIERFIEDHQLHPKLCSLFLSVLEIPSYQVRAKAIKYIAELRTIGSIPIETVIDRLIEVLHDHDHNLFKSVLRIFVQLDEVNREKIYQKLCLAFGEKHAYIGEYTNYINTKAMEGKGVFMGHALGHVPGYIPGPGLRAAIPESLFSQLLGRTLMSKPSLPEASPSVPFPITDQVKFSVSAPMVSVPGARFILGVWAHRCNINEVLQRARHQQKGADVYIATKEAVPVERETLLQVDLSIPEFCIDHLSDTIYWFGSDYSSIGNCTFPVAIPQDIATGMYFGEVKIRLRHLQIAKLDFVLEVGLEESTTDDITSFEKRCSTAFASYSHNDRNKVLGRIQGMLKVLPDLDIFLDVASLRSGENWLKRLQEEIEARDLFFLFWSNAASRSHWVETEWRIALETKGIDSISPVPLESPHETPPPKELSTLHFDEWTLAFEEHPKNTDVFTPD